MLLYSLVATPQLVPRTSRRRLHASDGSPGSVVSGSNLALRDFSCRISRLLPWYREFFRLPTFYTLLITPSLNPFAGLPTRQHGLGCFGAD
jgi:hypothetical protein